MKDLPRPGVDPTDDDLVRESRAGNGSAFGLLVERHHGAAFSLAVSILRDHHRAEDAVQDAFVRAWGAISRFRGSSTFRTWLLVIVANTARAELGKVKAKREIAMDVIESTPSSEPDPERQAVVSSEAAKARTFLAALPEKQRIAVTLRVETGLSFREIGKIAGSSEGSARVNYFYGIRKLREAMAES